VKTLIGKEDKVQQALEKLNQLSLREGLTIGALTMSVTSKILDRLGAAVSSVFPFGYSAWCLIVNVFSG
jgi:hypothetical protein